MTVEEAQRYSLRIELKPLVLHMSLIDLAIGLDCMNHLEPRLRATRDEAALRDLQGKRDFDAIAYNDLSAIITEISLALKPYPEAMDPATWGDIRRPTLTVLPITLTTNQAHMLYAAITKALGRVRPIVERAPSTRPASPKARIIWNRALFARRAIDDALMTLRARA